MALSRGVRRTVAGCVLLVLVYFALPLRGGAGPAELVIRVVASTLGLVLAVRLIGRQVRRQLQWEQTPVSGLVVALVAAVLFFALIDYEVALSSPGEFSGLDTRLDALYFALTTVSTVGYGDVFAQGQLARAVVCVQLLFNGVVIATAASVLARQLRRRLVARRDPGPAGPDPDEGV